MQKIAIKYRFQGFPFIVADGKGEFYQLPHCEKKYFKSFRKLKRMLNNGVTEGYRINRKFVSLNQLRQKAYISVEIIEIGIEKTELPF